MIITMNAGSVYTAAKTTLAGLALLLGMSTVGHCTAGCDSIDPIKDTLSDPAHNYATEIIGCAATAGLPGAYDYAEDMRCRDRVDQRYGVGRYRDSGLPADAGKEGGK